MASDVTDHQVDRFIDAIYAGNEIPSVANELYLPAIETETFPALPETIATTTVKTVSVFVPPVAAAVEVATGLTGDDVQQARRIASYLALRSALHMLHKVGEPGPQASSRLFLQAAIVEFERFRCLSDRAHTYDRFVIAVLQALAAARLSDSVVAQEFAAPAFAYLDKTVASMRERARTLETERAIAQRKLDRVRSSFTEEQINESGARLELGLLSDDPIAAAREPIKVIAYGQAEVDRIQRSLRELIDRINVYVTVRERLTKLLGAA